MSLSSLRSPASAPPLYSGTSAATLAGHFDASHCSIGLIADRPARSASTISAGDLPEPQIAPVPVMTMRCALAIRVTRAPGARPLPRGCGRRGSCWSRRSRASWTARSARRCWRGSPRTMLTSQSGSISRRFALTGSVPVWIASAHTAASTAPAAAMRWPITLLVELTATRRKSSPNTARTAAHSLRSFIGVEVPCAFR